MRSRTILLLLLVLAAMACATFWPRPTPVVWTIYAQSLPVTKTLAWDANPPGDAVLTYTVQLDSVTIGTPTGTTQLVTFTTGGAHVLRVSATNMWGTSGWATLNANVVGPGSPGNLHFQ